MSRILIVGDNGVRDPDPAFVTRLRAFDDTLTVFWNARRKRWIVEQCIEHKTFNQDGTHSHLCRRIPALVVQDDEKDMLPLGQHVIDKLAAARKFSESFGEGSLGLERFKKHVREVEAEQKAIRERKQREIMRDNSKDNKRQLEQVRHLMQQHDMRPNR